MYSLDYIYTKKHFKKIVKWCTEDPSCIWYDPLEQEQLDFQEMKQIYKDDILNPNYKTAESQRADNYKEMMTEYRRSEDPRQLKFINDQKVNYGDIFVNPSFHQSFVKLRMQTDRWGRRMLLKPNRKYDRGQHLPYYKYVAHDYLNKWFTISMLDDADQNDCLIPQSQTDYMIDCEPKTPVPSANLALSKNRSMQSPSDEPIQHLTMNSGLTGSDDKVDEEDPFDAAVRFYEDPNTLERFMQPKFSKNLQKIRTDLLARLDRSRLLNSIMF